MSWRLTSPPPHHSTLPVFVLAHCWSLHQSNTAMSAMGRGSTGLGHADPSVGTDHT